MNPRPEQTFFQDSSVDRAVGMVMTLAAELYVARDHVRVLETLLVEKGILEAGEVASFAPQPEAQAQWDSDRDAFVSALMENMRAEQVSKGMG